MLVRQCKEYLNSLGQSNQINLVWVPGHSGMEGNEKAVRLAITDSETRTYMPEPYLNYDP